ncbi:2-oxoisovalerate dehydrogenase E2 component (dihydrolipoyl transacylase) [Thermoactinomyces sp. DSM 45891]|uniref:dihydrolipoamide acetyltransferase family protein n=1 Tax=Thermoactinomyces sp. DSM 45891 TaxID=1761907 RepID=UPI00091F72C3|nr:dihydrolipoamide acetyltransferase family protein [Thermoactinomyces sp. DSM 45891]SFX04319.1 2-oxoisovalerate dehydrogenase E2 component (dihydrolipoyl transacylase) [Thermoactinomyces sp. DSM 45891]
MATEIKMPQLGESVTEGTIAKWLKKPGDPVAKYEAICEVSTDKVNAEVPATFEGTMVEIVAGEGETVAVGEIICKMAEEGAEEASTAAPATPAVEESKPATTNASSPAPAKVDLAGKRGSDSGRFSPAVLRLSQEHDIDLTLLTGTGAGGRITRKDILTAIEQGIGKVGSAPAPQAVSMDESVVAQAPTVDVDTALSTTPPASKPAMGVVTEEGDIEIPLTSVRKTIASRMVQSKHEAPHAWTMMEVDVTGLVELRNKMKNDFKVREGVSLTFMPFFIKAVSDALKEFPVINSMWGGDKIVQKKRINISIAVATDDALYVPVIPDVDELSILGLAKKVNTLAQKTRAGKLDLSDLQGGTFTVNNTGSFGSVMSQPIINQPQAAILSFEAIVKRPVVVNHMFAVRDMMNICMSLDHRVLDGLVAGRFLARVKELLEEYTVDSTF